MYYYFVDHLLLVRTHLTDLLSLEANFLEISTRKFGMVLHLSPPDIDRKRVNMLMEHTFPRSHF